MKKNAESINILSERELEIVAFAAKGMKGNEISKALYISTATVEKHRNNILRKLKCANITEVVAVAMRNGWIE